MLVTDWPYQESHLAMERPPQRRGGGLHSTKGTIDRSVNIAGNSRIRFQQFQ
jgi:hypothetical protein